MLLILALSGFGAHPSLRLDPSLGHHLLHIVLICPSVRLTLHWSARLFKQSSNLLLHIGSAVLVSMWTYYKCAVPLTSFAVAHWFKQASLAEDQGRHRNEHNKRQHDVFWFEFAKLEIRPFRHAQSPLANTALSGQCNFPQVQVRRRDSWVDGCTVCDNWGGDWK